MVHLVHVRKCETVSTRAPLVWENKETQEPGEDTDPTQSDSPGDKSVRFRILLQRWDKTEDSGAIRPF